MFVKSVSVNNNINEEIKVKFRWEISDSPKPLVIFMHGFKGFAEWGFLPYLAEKFVENGSISANIDFSLNGIENIELPWYDSEKFSRNSFTQELKDLDIIIEHFLSQTEKYEMLSNWNKEIYLVGHSLGGAVAIMTALRRKEIRKIALLAPIAYLHRNTLRQKEIWIKNQAIEIKIAKTNQILTLGSSYILDKDNYANDELINCIGKLELPILIIHGSQDLTVKPLESELLTKANEKYVKLIIVEKANHIFGVSHPMVSTNPQLEVVLSNLIEFCKKNEQL